MTDGPSSSASRVGRADAEPAAVNSASVRSASSQSSRVATSRGAWIGLLAPLLVSLSILIVAFGRLDAPFSQPHNGYNTAVWATGARAVRADGWWASRLGAVDNFVPGATPYAHHPPLTRIEVGLAERVLGEHRWVDRLPAMLSSIAAVWLCWGWLGALGFRQSAQSLGVLAVGATAFFVEYSNMLNMEAVWLPFAFALLWVWRKSEIAGGGAAACFALGVGGALASHQGLLLAWALAGWSVIAAARDHRQLRRHEAGVVGAAVAGSLLFVGWVRWAAGGFDDLFDSAGQRGGGVTWGHFAAMQWGHGLAVFGLIGLVCLGASLVAARSKPELQCPVVCVWVVAAAYAVVFREGASIHDYWNVALVPMVALGGAFLADRMRRMDPRAPVAACGIVALAMLVSSLIAARDDQADAMGRLARSADTSTSPALGSTLEVGRWLTYETGNNVEQLSTCASIAALHGRDSDAMVFTNYRWIEIQHPGAWEAVSHSAGTTTANLFALATADTILNTACVDL